MDWGPVLCYSEEWQLFGHDEFVWYLMSHGESRNTAQYTWDYYIRSEERYKVICRNSGKYLIWWRVRKSESWRNPRAEMGIQCNLDAEVAEVGIQCNLDAEVGDVAEVGEVREVAEVDLDDPSRWQ